MYDEQQVKECVRLVDETISDLMSEMSADTRIAFLAKVHAIVTEMLNELNED